MKIEYNKLNWNQLNQEVLLIQRRILVAWKSKDLEQVRNLQDRLVRTLAARAISVKKVTSSKGGKTPGVDKKIITTDEEKIKLIEDLKNLKEYIPSPIRRVYIPKSIDKMRPLGIPTIKDRAMQALFLLTLEPLVEETGDKRSYGFRKYRSTQDVQKYLRQCLAKADRARYILDCDIKGFFDNINHEWILKNIPMDKEILKKWLKADIFDKNILQPNSLGVPQGGVISPAIANMVLDGLEGRIEEYKKKKDKELTKEKKSSKINFVRYADDFVITGNEIEYLEEIKIIVSEFLNDRGLSLNNHKTKIFNIKTGFDFLGFNFKKYKTSTRNAISKNEILLIKPSNKAIQKVKNKIKISFKGIKPLEGIIEKLNPILRGWGNYFKYTNSKRIFTIIDTYVYYCFIRWLRRKSGGKRIMKAYKKYVHPEGNRQTNIKVEKNEKEYKLFRLETITIKNYIMVKNLNPFEEINEDYFKKREYSKVLDKINPYLQKLMKKQKAICPVCKQLLESEEEALEVHHIRSKKDGGKEELKNLLILHKTCHVNITNCKDPRLRAEYIQKGIIKP